jgi:hypothetical protein
VRNAEERWKRPRLVETAIRRSRHLVFDDLFKRLLAKRTITIAQSKPPACIAFATSNTW